MNRRAPDVALTIRTPHSLADLIESRIGPSNGRTSSNYSVEIIPSSETAVYSPSVYSRADHQSTYDYDPYSSGEHAGTLSVPYRHDATLVCDDYQEDDGAEDVFDHEEPPSRLSVMGPKMKMLSKAPWEDGENYIEEEDLPQDDSSESFGRKRSYTPTVTSIHDESKGWKGFSKAKPNLKETISSPISTIGSDWDNLTQTQRQRYGTPSKYSVTRTRASDLNNSDPRARSVASSVVSRSSYSSASATPLIPSPGSECFPVSAIDSPFPRSTPGPPSDESIAQQGEFMSGNVHPYANPEICNPVPSKPYAYGTRTKLPSEIPESLSGKPSTYPRSDSVITVTANSTPNNAYPASTILASAPVVTFPGRSITDTPSSLAPDVGHQGMQGFPGSPAYNLISLEQARDRVRERSKSSSTPQIGKNSQSKLDEPHSYGAPALPFRHTSSQTSLSTFVSSSSVSPSTPSTPAKGKSHLYTRPAESPPLPPVPVMPATSGKALKPKRSGFLKLFPRDKEKQKERMGDMFQPVPLIASISSSTTDLSLDPTDGSFTSLPPIPSIPAQYRSSSTESAPQSSGNIGRDFAPILRARVPSAPPRISSPKQPSMNDLGKSISLSLNSKKQPRSATLGIPQIDAEPSDLQFQSLKLRPVSSLFSSGLPMDLMLSTDNTGKSPSTVFNRRNPGLGIGIPENNAVDLGADFYSPVTESSMSSTFRRSTATPSTLGGPVTPTSFTISSNSSSSFFASTSVSASLSQQQQPLYVQLQAAQDRLVQERKAWQLQRWEYEGQIRDLQNELAELQTRACIECGFTAGVSRSTNDTLSGGTSSAGMLNRPRQKTGGTVKYNEGLSY